jgi:hypothetical protein
MGPRGPAANVHTMEKFFLKIPCHGKIFANFSMRWKILIRLHAPQHMPGRDLGLEPS